MWPDGSVSSLDVPAAKEALRVAAVIDAPADEGVHVGQAPAAMTLTPNMAASCDSKCGSCDSKCGSCAQGPGSCWPTSTMLAIARAGVPFQAAWDRTPQHDNFQLLIIRGCADFLQNI